MGGRVNGYFAYTDGEGANEPRIEQIYPLEYRKGMLTLVSIPHIKRMDLTILLQIHPLMKFSIILLLYRFPFHQK